MLTSGFLYRVCLCLFAHVLNWTTVGINFKTLNTCGIESICFSFFQSVTPAPPTYLPESGQIEILVIITGK